MGVYLEDWTRGTTKGVEVTTVEVGRSTSLVLGPVVATEGTEREREREWGCRLVVL